ncbi:CD2 antigen cytoplasmic tail-binding protein 2 homolog [Condylostylus longicornis]|uniref:CD2 antigen cytoplasmic tail-binding protein 2 homolog n=1 Tax=Condylostylus longicornis TaxID=2530218 RepID=UPI00244E412F|nr:CD2 antigen cytoplasmic tail-binding protein 2 homolog [Condylostylus longicornis]
MASKRNFEDLDADFYDAANRKQARFNENEDYVKKHTLDSDEEDSGAEEERYNVMHEDDIEGEEDGISSIRDETKITPFNMKEELEEGHFDREGHFQWKKDKEIRDNWLDNIDWIKVKTDKKYIEKTNTGLADSSDDDENGNSKGPIKVFNEISTYKEILEYMKPGETLAKTLQRLGKNKQKFSSVERWRRKKTGMVDTEGQAITKLTELANNILTNLGNMDVYQETYEMIERKINKSKSKIGKSSKIEGNDLDMYAEDFDQKEKTKLQLNETSNKNETNDSNKNSDENLSELPKLQWEYKWKQDDEQIHGPFTTEQMQKWVDENYFPNGVFVRKYNIEDQKFYNSNRIDFELYL